MKPVWVVFDVGGVILDWHTSRDATIKRLGVTTEEFTPVFNKYVSLMEYGKLEPVLGFKQILNDLHLNHDVNEIYNYWQSNLVVIDSTSKLINKLSKHYNLAICTNTWTGAFQKYNLDQFPEVFSPFKKYIDSSVIHLAKPSTEIYMAVESEIGSAGNQIFFIDDSLLNIISAQEFGWQTYLFKNETDQIENSCHQLAKILLNRE